MTGLDASKQFVQVLDSSPHYSHAREKYLGCGSENFDQDLKGAFDVVTASGVFLKSHMPKEAMDDCYEALRPGGYFVTAMRDIYWQEGNEEGYREKIDELIEAEKFELQKSCTFERGVPEGIGLFAPFTSYLLVFRKKEKVLSSASSNSQD